MHMATVEESIIDILFTPIGSRVCLPEYGSRLHELIDRRVDSEFKADLTRYVFEALLRWEKRVKPISLQGFSNDNGRLYFQIVLDNGEIVGVRK